MMPDQIKRTALQVSRDLLKDRVVQGAQDEESRIFFGLCPELHDSKIDRLAAPTLLPKLIAVRVADQRTCVEHDARYIMAQVESASSSLPTADLLDPGP